jgi:putative Mg2+ transporter-C (MgtC) family protein
MTGIGFVGGGAILKEGEQVKGTSTAAAVWGAGAIGGSVAFGRFELAVAIAAVTFVIFLALTPLEGLISEADGESESG